MGRQIAPQAVVLLLQIDHSTGVAHDRFGLTMVPGHMFVPCQRVRFYIPNTFYGTGVQICAHRSYVGPFGPTDSP